LACPTENRPNALFNLAEQFSNDFQARFLAELFGQKNKKKQKTKRKKKQNKTWVVPS